MTASDLEQKHQLQYVQENLLPQCANFVSNVNEACWLPV